MEAVQRESSYYIFENKTLIRRNHYSVLMEKLSSGNSDFDTFLGGYETDIITTFYGPSGSGKTNFCLLCAVNVAKNKKVIYIDTEGGLSVERIRQLSLESDKVLDNLIIFKPTTFYEQVNAVSGIKKIVNSGNIGLIIVDTIAMLYRLELGNSEEVYEINRSLGKQIALLAEIARKKNIPIIITNQVYADFDNKDKVNMVGGDLLKYGSKCLLELQKTPEGLRRAIIRKHRFMPEEKEFIFKIIDTGIEKTKESKGFKLF